MTIEERIQKLEDRVQAQQNIINAFVLSTSYIFNRNIVINDSRSVQLGTDKGTMFGTSTTQKLAFFGATPLSQQTAILTPSGGTTIDDEARTTIGLLITLMHKFGFTA
jgi:hypothetical protein